MKLSSVAVAIVACVGSAHGQFDFGGGGGSCDGSGTFQQQVSAGTRLEVGEIPVGLEGLEIALTSPEDVDIQLISGSTEVINWQGGILS